MGKLSVFFTILKANMSLGAVILAFYMGTQYHYRVEKIEHNLLNSHLEYSPHSHRGSLGFRDMENNQGQLEKKLTNLETGETIYTLRPDCLPENDYVYEGLSKRACSADADKLKNMQKKTEELEGLIDNRLRSSRNADQAQDNDAVWYLSASGILAALAAAYRKFRKSASEIN